MHAHRHTHTCDRDEHLLRGVSHKLSLCFEWWATSNNLSECMRQTPSSTCGHSLNTNQAHKLFLRICTRFQSCRQLSCTFHTHRWSMLRPLYQVFAPYLQTAVQ